MKLSLHFTLEEAVFSSTAVRLGIDNTMPGGMLQNMMSAAEQLEEVRTLLGSRKLHVDSWYRCFELNKAVRGSSMSAHTKGWAIDFTCAEFGSPVEICRAIIASPLEYDQLIMEGSWVHISFEPAMRLDKLTAHFTPGRPTTYTEGIA